VTRCAHRSDRHYSGASGHGDDQTVNGATYQVITGPRGVWVTPSNVSRLTGRVCRSGGPQLSEDFMMSLRSPRQRRVACVVI